MLRTGNPTPMLALVALLAAPATPTGTAESQAATSFADVWPGLIERIERGYVRGDASEMRAAVATLGELRETELTEDQRSLVRYTAAYANWRLAVLPDGAPDDDGRDALLDNAVELLDENLATNDGDAESHALLASVYGLQIGRSPLRGMLLGIRAGRASARAVELAPGNPRVLLLDGVGKLNTPRMFGGGEDKAELLLRQAVAAFTTEPPDRPWPRWGRIDAYGWLGQLMAGRGDVDAARQLYLRALEIEPAFAWVREVLLPALDSGARPE